MKDQRKPRSGRVQGGAREVGPNVVVDSNPLKLHYIPGTEGAGRVATTNKAGLFESGSLMGVTSRGISCLTIPTVAVANFVPTFTGLQDASSRAILSTALFKYYNSIRSRNASVSSYSPNSVFFANQAVVGLSMILGAIRVRLQVLCSEGSQVTAAYPAGLMDALNIQDVDRDYLASYISTYNQIIGLAKALIMPKSFKLFARQASLAATVYLDDPMISKSQLIVFNPERIYVWDLVATSPTVGQLLSVNVYTKVSTLGGRSYLHNMLIYALSLVQMYTMDVDMNNIYAEIRKAFDRSEVYEFVPFPVDGESVSVKFDQVLLDQLKNATLVGDIDNAYSPTLIEDSSTGEIVYEKGKIGAYAYQPVDSNGKPFADQTDADRPIATNKHFVYTHEDQPGEDTIADLLAFKAILDGDGHVTSCGTELITTIEIRHAPHSAGGPTKWYFKGINQFKPVTTTAALYNSVTSFLDAVRSYFSFSNLPVFDVTILDTTTNANWSVQTMEGDIDNRAPVTNEAIDLAHIASAAWLVTE